MKKYKYVGNKEYWYPNLRTLERADTITGNSLTVSIYEDNKSYKIPNRPKKEKVSYQNYLSDCKTKSIKLQLDNDGQKLLSNWSYVYLKAYNIARQYDIEFPQEWTGVKNAWKNKVMKYLSENYLSYAASILRDKHSIALSICEYHKNKKSALSNLKGKNITHFNLRPKPLSKKIVVMEFEKTSANSRNPIGQVVYNFHHLINKQFAIQFNRYNRTANLLIRVSIEQLEEPNREYTPVSVDLGLRTFASCYDFNRYICVGNNNSKLNNLISLANNKQANFSSKKAEKRYRKKRFKKIKNIVKDIHYKTAHFLCSNYSEVYVGDFKSKACKEVGNNKSIKQRLNQYSFYKFKDTLDYIAIKYNTKVSRWNEYLSSRSCSWCGYDNKLLGSNEIYKCPKCKKQTYRDCNAARNGMIRVLS